MTSSLLNIARTGLQVSQYQLNTTGNNISNANTPGYSRQRVDVVTQTEFQTGGGYLGSGAKAVDVERIANQFVIEQIRSNSSAFNQLDTYSVKLSQLDNLLAADSSGLSNSFNDYFSALATAADDPSSLPARESVLSQLNILTQRFNAIDSTMTQMSETMDAELENFSDQVNTLSSAISGLNKQISSTYHSGNSMAPNALLDQRDEMVRQLSELVNVNATPQSDGGINIYIGNGQALVIGDSINKLGVVMDPDGSQKSELSFNNGYSEAVVTDDITGGKLGGILDYRKNVMEPAQRELGQLAISFADSMNSIQAGGVDLNGHYGGNLFVDINDRSATLGRVAYDRDNAVPLDRIVSVEITDTSLLTSDDFVLQLSGDRPDVYELKDPQGNVLQSGGLSDERPFVIKYGGIQINLESGHFSNKDEFTISPTATGAKNLQLSGLKAGELALAQPIVTATGDSNVGSGTISRGDVIGVLDPKTGERLPAFANEGKLGPPLLVRFTSETSYDVLDNSDPANPVSLNPPLENLKFTPGKNNQILPGNDGQRVVISDGFNAGRVPNSFEVASGGVGTEAISRIVEENITITRTFANGLSENVNVNIPAGTSASQAAYLLSQAPGVTATASTYTEFSITDDGVSGTFELTLNGKQITLPQTDALGPLPSPMTNDYLAKAINHDGNLQAQGIRAVSDGLSVKVYSNLGVDLKFQMQGDSDTDYIEFKGKDAALAQGTKLLTGAVDFNTGGPNSFVMDVFDGPGGVSQPRTIELEGSFSDPELLVQHVQAQIDKSYGESGRAVVSLAADGTLKIESGETDMNTKIQITGPLGADPLGLAAAVGEGVLRPNDILRVDGPGYTASTQGTVNLTGAVDLDAGGPNSFIIDVFDGVDGVSQPQTINIAGNFTDPDLLVQHVQAQIDASYGSPGKAVVSLDANGRLNIETGDSSVDAKIQITGPLGADPLGLTASVGLGVQQGDGLTQVNSVTITGELAVTLEDGYSLSSDAAAQGNFFSAEPESKAAYLGYAVAINGNPDSGDEFSVNFNSDASGDNRNAQAFIDTKLQDTVGGAASFSTAYGQMVERVASETYEANSNRTAAEVVLRQAVDHRDSISAVSLDEEAANLIKFEQLFKASSQVINVSRQLFDTLLGLSG